MSTPQKKYSLARRLFISISLLIYFAVWAFAFYCLHTLPEEENQPGAILGLMVLAAGNFLFFFVLYLFAYWSTSAQNQNEYAVAIALLFLPFIVLYIDFKISSPA